MTTQPGDKQLSFHGLQSVIEGHEAEAWFAFAASASRQQSNPMGAVALRGTRVLMTAMTAVNFAGLNRVIGLGVGSPATTDDILEIEEFYGSLNQTRFTIDVAPTIHSDQLISVLRERGYRQLDQTVVKSWHPLNDVPFPRGGPEVVLLDTEYKDQWSRLHRRVRQTPRLFGHWFVAGFDDPRFFHWGIVEDGVLLAGAAGYLSDRLLWCGFSATLPEARGRGFQTLLARERLRFSQERECYLAHVENDPDTSASASIGLHNMKKVGYQVLYERAQFVSS